jgi:hypothetical protein
VKLALIVDERDLENDFGIYWRRRLSVDARDGYGREQQNGKSKQFLCHVEATVTDKRSDTGHS